MSDDVSRDRVHAGSRRIVNATVGCLLVPILVVVVCWGIWIKNNRAPNIPIPTPTLPRPNAYDDFLRAGVLATKIKHKSPYSQALRVGQPAFSFASYAACAKDAQPAIEALRIGLRRPYLFPAVRSFSTDASALFGTESRELERTLEAAADYDRLVGRPLQSADIRLDGMEMAVTMPKGGDVLTDLIAIADENLAGNGFEELIPLLSASDLAHVAARLDRIAAKRVPCSDVMLEEAYSEAAVSAELVKGPNGYATFKGVKTMFEPDDADSDQPKQTFRDRAEVKWKEGSFLLANKERMIRDNLAYGLAVAAEFRKPYRGATLAVKPPENPLEELFGFPLAVREKHLRQEAVVAILRTEVALYRYRAAHGAFPDSLRPLSPAYLSVLPDDPFGGGGGRTLQYRKRGAGHLLYSLGPDMKDYGGVPARHIGGSGGNIVAGSLYRRRLLPKAPAGMRRRGLDALGQLRSNGPLRVVHVLSNYCFAAPGTATASSM